MSVPRVTAIVLAVLLTVEVLAQVQGVEQDAAPPPHWAYAPFRAVDPPTVSEASWVVNSIDRFVLARLEGEGLTLSAPADRRTLIRRLSLDLVGMSPTLDELETFLADDRADAYERLVDRLLASPHYAERWARHWLDLARYADSNGYTIDGARSMWPYRDWVIQAITEGMPFDQFTIEQLAGDLLDNPTNAQVVATGFHRNTQINQEGGAKDEENRVNAVIDRTNTTGAIWLGSTLACAQCHTHKFDPLPHVEYYRMLAFFDQTQDGGVSVGPAVQVTDDTSAPRLERFESMRLRLGTQLDVAARAAAYGWTRWTPTVALASEGPELSIAADASIRSIAHNPQTSVYDLEGSVPGPGIAAIRLEVLPDLALPVHGPGRAADGSFVLSRMRLLARSSGTDNPFEERPFSRADADYASSGNPASEGPVAGALSDAAGTGWAVAPRVGEAHVAVFQLAEPLAGAFDIRLELRHDHGRNHVLGRFRVSFAPGAAAGPVVTDVWRAAWAAVVAQTRPARICPGRW